MKSVYFVGSKLTKAIFGKLNENNGSWQTIMSLKSDLNFFIWCEKDKSLQELNTI